MFEKIINKEYKEYSKLSKDKKVFYLEKQKSMNTLIGIFFIYPALIGIFGALIHPLFGFMVYIISSITCLIGMWILSFMLKKQREVE